MFDFLKKESNTATDEEVQEVLDKLKKQAIPQDVDDYFRSLIESLEYTNSYLAQIGITLGELTKQLTILNALHILDSEYNNADSLMDVEEILQKKNALFGSIFVDYQTKEENMKENE